MKRKLRPFHEHPLLQNYRSNIGPTFMHADWYCQHCGEEIIGPPFEVGEYVVTNVPLWRVWMKSTFWNPGRAPLFETTRKREALRHASQLEARRRDILRALGGDKGDIAENFKAVEKLRTEERNS